MTKKFQLPADVNGKYATEFPSTEVYYNGKTYHLDRISLADAEELSSGESPVLRPTQLAESKAKDSK